MEKACLLETALRADFSLLGAFLADYSVGLIVPDHVVTPAPLVDLMPDKIPSMQV